MELVKYDAMIHAIQVCESVDEVKDVRDKYLALEAYAKQAKNRDAERKCATVRVRAERKCGELLAQLGKGTKTSKPGEVISEYKQTCDRANINKDQASNYQKLAAIDEDIFEERIQAVLDEGSKKPTATRIINTVRGTTGTGENEWYTPQKYIESARKVLGSINLDPASSELANKYVRAEVFYDESTDGLSQDWNGSVWMNPPYAQPHIEQFMLKLSDEYFNGNISSGIALTHNYTDTKWFQYAQARADALCFTKGRIAFVNPAGEKAAPTQGQAFFYFGKDLDSFFREFSQYGFVVKGVSLL